MSVDPDKAIEKLAQYRKESKKPEFHSSDDKTNVEESPIRKFFLQYYWFNAMVVTSISFALIIAGWWLLNPMINVSLAAIGLLLTRQTLRTIERLNQSKGRKTTVDDAFVILLIAIMFLIVSIFLDLPQTIFVAIHLTLVVVWMVQIYFVNFRKPDFGSIVSKKGAIVEEEEKEFKQTVIDFFTRERSILMVISLVVAVLLSLPTLS